MAKLEHGEVKFEHPAQGPDHCYSCVHYDRTGPRCEIVKPPIHALDWCKRFVERYKLKEKRPF